MMDSLRDYYKSTPPDLSAISDLGFRHFRFRRRDNRFMKVDRKVYSSTSLQRLLVRYLPADAYYTSSCWLNPHILGPRDEEDLLGNLFIKGDVVFDIDEKPFNASNIEKARKKAAELYGRLLDLKIKVKYLAFSGGKGFHIVCADPNTYVNDSPAEREGMALEYRKKLAETLSGEGLAFDVKVTVDTRRIIRVPGTVNYSTGYVCTILSEEQFVNDSAWKMLKYVPRVRLYAPWTSVMRGYDRCFQQFCTKMGWFDRVGVRPHPQNHFESSVSSVVLGTKRQIIILRYPHPKKGDIEGIRNRISTLINRYDMGDVFLFRNDIDLFAISLKTFDLKRAEKILKASGSNSLYLLKKYKQTYMRVGLKMDEEGSLFGQRLMFIGLIDGGGGTYDVSRPHMRFLSDNGVPIPKYGRVHGGDEVVIAHVMVE